MPLQLLTYIQTFTKLIHAGLNCCLIKQQNANITKQQQIDQPRSLWLHGPVSICRFGLV